MALSYSNVDIIHRGKYQVLYADATFDSSYASGGETINASDFGLYRLLAVHPSSKEGYNVRYVKTNDTTGVLKVFASFTPDTSSAVAAPIDSSVGRDYSTVTAALIIYGQ